MQKKEGIREQANVVHAESDVNQATELPHVILENNDENEARVFLEESCLFVRSVPKITSDRIRIPEAACRQAVSFLESRLNNYPKGIIGVKKGRISQCPKVEEIGQYEVLAP